MELHVKLDIDSDISLSAVTNVFCILRDVAMRCITVGFIATQLRLNWRSSIRAMVHLMWREIRLFNDASIPTMICVRFILY